MIKKEEFNALTDKEIIAEVEEKLEKDVVNISDFLKNLDIPKSTFYRYKSGETVLKPSIKRKLFNFLNEEIYLESDSIFSRKIASTRVTPEVYDYITGTADKLKCNATDVVRMMLENEINADNLQKNISQNLEIAEAAFARTIEKRLIPFLKQQDKIMEQIYFEQLWLEEMLFRIGNSNTDDEVRENWQDEKEIFIVKKRNELYQHYED